jgi:hypothetical protein
MKLVLSVLLIAAVPVALIGCQPAAKPNVAMKTNSSPDLNPKAPLTAPEAPAPAPMSAPAAAPNCFLRRKNSIPIADGPRSMTRPTPKM